MTPRETSRSQAAQCILVQRPVGRTSAGKTYADRTFSAKTLHRTHVGRNLVRLGVMKGTEMWAGRMSMNDIA